MPSFIDQVGKAVEISAPPLRIISLVPSQTELLADLGLDKEVIGITKFCVHPETWFRNKTRVGGTKQLNINIIHQLKPDLIIANKEENVKEQVEELEKYYPVWVSDVNNLDDAYKMITSIGEITGKQQQANQIIDNIKENFSLFTPQLPIIIGTPFTTAYFIWQNPYMTVGGDTFIHSMLEAAGFKNMFADRKRYPEITVDDLLTTNCQLLLLSSEPFPFKQKHVDELKDQLPNTRIMLVDGEMFSWYGSRLQYAPAYFRELHRCV